MLGNDMLFILSSVTWSCLQFKQLGKFDINFQYWMIYNFPMIISILYLYFIRIQNVTVYQEWLQENRQQIKTDLLSRIINLLEVLKSFKITKIKMYVIGSRKSEKMKLSHTTQTSAILNIRTLFASVFTKCLMIS